MTETAKAVTSIGASLGVRNKIKTVSDVIEKADDEDYLMKGIKIAVTRVELQLISM